MKLLAVIFFVSGIILLAEPAQKEHPPGNKAKASPAWSVSNYADIHDSTHELQQQNVTETDSETNTDTQDTPDIIRNMPQDFIEKYKNEKDFNYDDNNKSAGIFDLVSAWIDEQIQRILLSNGFGVVSRYIGYLIIIIAIIFVFLILRKSKISGIIYGGEGASNNFKEYDEDINSIDLEKLFNEAVGSKNYRLALRFCYLKMLKALAEKNIIDWQINKTNYQYLSEIKEESVKKMFSDLTLIFEYIWYGEMNVEERLFNDSLEVFNKLNSSLAEKR